MEVVSIFAYLSSSFTSSTVGWQASMCSPNLLLTFIGRDLRDLLISDMYLPLPAPHTSLSFSGNTCPWLHRPWLSQMLVGLSHKCLEIFWLQIGSSASTLTWGSPKSAQCIWRRPPPVLLYFGCWLFHTSCCTRMWSWPRIGHGPG